MRAVHVPSDTRRVSHEPLDRDDVRRLDVTGGSCCCGQAGISAHADETFGWDDPEARDSSVSSRLLARAIGSVGLYAVDATEGRPQRASDA
jgi:hypothetical protein